jgi:hypothetical protein
MPLNKRDQAAQAPSSDAVVPHHAADTEHAGRFGCLGAAIFYPSPLSAGIAATFIVGGPAAEHALQALQECTSSLAASMPTLTK